MMLKDNVCALKANSRKNFPDLHRDQKLEEKMVDAYNLFYNEFDLFLEIINNRFNYEYELSEANNFYKNIDFDEETSDMSLEGDISDISFDDL